MVDIRLVDVPVDTDKFESFDGNLPTLFLGFAIKNEYDHERLSINKKYNPKKVLIAFEKEADSYAILPLYGLFLELNKTGKELADTLLKQQKEKAVDIVTYEQILDEYSMTCHDAYSYLNKRIFPIDFKAFTHLTDNPIIDDKKILQHLLELDESEFNFQRFGAFKLLILTK
jgi:hypothetical protein